MNYEFWAIPAPQQTKRTKGEKSAVETLANGMTALINDMASEGWEYLRSETLAVQDKPGRFSKMIETVETILIFRREMDIDEQPNSPALYTYPVEDENTSDQYMQSYDHDTPPPREDHPPQIEAQEMHTHIETEAEEIVDEPSPAEAALEYDEEEYPAAHPPETTSASPIPRLGGATRDR